MAILLHLETATTNCSVGISSGDSLLSLKENNAVDYSHSEQLHLFIKEALAGASLSFSDLDAVAVSKGPGSYTGLRIGVSAAKGLCFSLDLPLIAVPTLEALARQVEPKAREVVVPVLDARRMEVYSAVFDSQYRELRETRAEIIDPDSFGEYRSMERIHFLGNGAKKIQETLRGGNFSFDASAVPSAAQMVPLAHRKFQASDFEDLAYFEPYYLKDFLIQPKKGA